MKNIFYSFLLFILFLILFPAVSHAETGKIQLIIINKLDHQLTLYENHQKIKTFEVATGKTKSLTPEGVYTVSVKWECPLYYKTNKKACAKDNPLGPRWLGLNVPGTNGYTYGVHGTNLPNSIGTSASSGCVRMHNQDVTWLFSRINKGAKVIITNSNQTHDEIAKKQGYQVKNAVKLPQVLSQSQVKVNGMLNIRSTASTNGKIIGSIPNKANVKLYSVSGKWAKIQYGNKTGYVHTDYLKNKPSSNSKTPAKTEKPINNKVHTVVRGDTLYKISNKYGISVKNIQSTNKLTSNTIHIGQKLIIKK